MLASVQDGSVTIQQIAERLEAIKLSRDALAREEKLLKGEVFNRYGEALAAAYTAKGETFGAVNLNDGEFVIAVTTPKKIKWDQKKMAALFQQIAATDNPLDYISVEYDVPESKYKNWPEVIRTEFLDARTIEPGTPTLTIKRKGE